MENERTSPELINLLQQQEQKPQPQPQPQKEPEKQIVKTQDGIKVQLGWHKKK